MILTLWCVVRIKEDQSSAVYILFIVDTYCSKNSLLVNIKSLLGHKIQHIIKLHQICREWWLLGRNIVTREADILQIVPKLECKELRLIQVVKAWGKSPERVFKKPDTTDFPFPLWKENERHGKKVIYLDDIRLPFARPPSALCWT